MKKVSIIMLTWNGLEYTKKCIESLFENTKHDNYELVVVDNASSDGTQAYLRELQKGHGNLKLIENKENLGFVQGNNVALREIVDSGEDVDALLLNNDMVITQSGWLSRLQSFAYEREDTGLVGCRLVNHEGMFLHAGTEIYPETYWGQQIGGGDRDMGQYRLNTEVGGVVFACVYIKNNVLKEVGLLNEAFFSYFEDTDYCLRVLEHGYKCMYCGEVSLIHIQNVSTDVNEVDFSDMFLASQASFKKIWDKKLTSRYTDRLAWHSIVNFPSGYAVSSKNIMMALDKKNVEVSYRYVYGEGTPFPVPEPEKGDSYVVDLIRGRPFSEDIPQVVYGQGDVFFKNTGKYKIGYTMLEVTGIPPEWVRQANLMDEVWVPSRFNVETFRNSGVRVPIHVVPLGVDPHRFNPLIDSFKNRSKYTFLSVFEWGERKAPEVLLRAFARAFKKSDDVALICKVFNNDGSINVQQEVQNMNLPGGAEIVFLYNQKFPGNQMPNLYASADCFVLPTRGEGWGMPILEAMACGLPTIATAWSSQVDFMTEQNSYMLPTDGLVPAEAKCPYYEGFSWGNPDEDALVEQLRYVYTHQREAKEKGLFASRDVLQNWTWANSAEKIKERLTAIGAAAKAEQK